jgi:4-amino-4-deoxy-L-arabinose transferase-like glycosyltransferase
MNIENTNIKIVETPNLSRQRPNPERERLTSLILIFAFIAAFILLLFWGIGQRSLWGSEGRWGEITREMFVSGDFFHPTIGGEPYFDKPLVTYWIIAGLSAISGQLNEFIIRLPSALAAVLAILATAWLGRKLWSAKVGLLAAGMLLTSYGLLMYSHIASAETENLAAVTLAVAWYFSRREKPGFITFLVFYLIIFIGSHMKGLTAFVVPVLILLPDLLCPRFCLSTERRGGWRMLLMPGHWLALAIGVGVYLIPFIIAAKTRPGSYGESGLFMVFQENIIRYIKPFDHKGPIYLYLGVVPLLTLPWVPIFIGALITTVPNWKKLDENARWLLMAVGLIFAFYTLSGSRRNYYILPILPFCMLLSAVFLVELSQEIVRKHRQRGKEMLRQLLIIAAIVEAVLGPMIVWYLITQKSWELPVWFAWSSMIIGVATLLVAVYGGRLISKIYHDEQLQPVVVSILASAILLGGFFSWQFNLIESLRTESKFAKEVKPVAETFPHENVAFFHRPEDKTIFYMKWNPPVTTLEDANELKVFLENKKNVMIIGQKRYVDETALALLPPKPTYEEASFKWEDPHKKLRAWVIKE